MMFDFETWKHAIIASVEESGLDDPLNAMTIQEYECSLEGLDEMLRQIEIDIKTTRRRG